MASKALILAESGNGKTASLRTINPEQAVVVQPIMKNLPFPGGSDWKRWEKGVGGDIIAIPSTETVINFLNEINDNYPRKEIIIIDDLIYLMTNQMMEDINDTGYDKWSLIADQFYRLVKTINSLRDNLRVYVLTHPETDANGIMKMKTVGALVDKALTPFGLFETVLGAMFKDGKYVFITSKLRNSDPYKSPIGMFRDIEIDNDLSKVDKRVCKVGGVVNTHVPIELNDDLTPKSWTKEQIDAFWEE